MKNFTLFTFCLLFSGLLFGQTTIYLGTGVTNGATTGGCDAACEGSPFDPANGVVCSGVTSGNVTGTATASITVPAGFFLDLDIQTVMCNASTHGLDGGDDLFVNGEKIVDGSANTAVDYQECFENTTSGSVTIDIAFTVNRRDEVVEVTYNVVAADPGTGGADGCNTTALVPVELSDFTAVLEKEQVVLNWITQTEQDNSHFVLEKSLDGIFFATLNELKGAGTTVEVQSYDVVDEKPYPGVNYYRLKQVDYDGTYKYSNILSVNTSKGNSGSKVYPSPTSGNITVETEEVNDKIQIMDLTGRILREFTELSTTKTQLDVTSLPAGIYFVAIQSDAGRGMEMVRFIKK